jgi:hypothetical protein
MKKEKLRSEHDCYTDKRTAFYVDHYGSHLDGLGRAALGSANHDQANQVR